MRLFALLPALASCVAVALPAPADKRLDEALAKAEAQLAKGKEDEAVKILEKAASQAPRDPELPLALARMLARLGKLVEAGKALGAAGELASAAPPTVRARVLAERSAFALRAGSPRRSRRPRDGRASRASGSVLRHRPGRARRRPARGAPGP